MERARDEAASAAVAATALLRRRELGLTAASPRSTGAVLERPPSAWAARVPVAAVLAHSPDSVLLGFARSRAWGDLAVLSYRWDGEAARAAADTPRHAAARASAFVFEVFDLALRDAAGRPTCTLRTPLFGAAMTGEGALTADAAGSDGVAASGPDHSSIRILVHECSGSGALAVFGYCIGERGAAATLPTPYHCTVLTPHGGLTGALHASGGRFAVPATTYHAVAMVAPPFPRPTVCGLAPAADGSCLVVAFSTGDGVRILQCHSQGAAPCPAGRLDDRAPAADRRLASAIRPVGRAAGTELRLSLLRHRHAGSSPLLPAALPPPASVPWPCGIATRIAPRLADVRSSRGLPYDPHPAPTLLPAKRRRPCSPSPAASTASRASLDWLPESSGDIAALTASTSPTTLRCSPVSVLSRASSSDLASMTHQQRCASRRQGAADVVCGGGSSDFEFDIAATGGSVGAAAGGTTHAAERVWGGGALLRAVEVPRLVPTGFVTSTQVDAEVLLPLCVPGRLANYDVRVVAVVGLTEASHRGLWPASTTLSMCDETGRGTVVVVAAAICDVLTMHQAAAAAPADAATDGRSTLRRGASHAACPGPAAAPAGAVRRTVSSGTGRGKAYGARPAAPRAASTAPAPADDGWDAVVATADGACLGSSSSSSASTASAASAAAVATTQRWRVLFAAAAGGAVALHVCEASALPTSQQPAFDRRGERGISSLTSDYVSALRSHLFSGWFGPGLAAPRELNNDAVVAGAPLTALMHPARPVALVAGGRRG